MAQVTVSINGRNYTIACGEGEEAHLKSLAAYVDGRVRQMASDVGQVGDTRLLLLTALLIADELSIAEGRAAELDSTLSQHRATRAEQAGQVHETEDTVVKILDAASRRIGELAARIG